MAESSKPTGLSAFVEGLYGKLSESWAAALVAPAAAFWVGLAVLWVTAKKDTGETAQLEEAYEWLAKQPQTTQIVVLVALLGGILLSALVVEAFVPTVQNLIAGQWPGPLSSVGLRLVNWQAKRIDKDLKHWEELAGDIDRLGGIEHIPADDRREYERLDRRTARIPYVRNRRAPTRLGNILEASASRPEAKYGLDFDACWPRLWLVLPDGARKEVTDARTILRTWLRVWIWGVVFLLAGVSLYLWPQLEALPAWLIGPAVGLAVAVYAHHRLFGAAEVYADILESCFDLYRKELYTALRWPLPANAAKEKTDGERLSQYVWRGLPLGDIVLIDAEGKSMAGEPPRSLRLSLKSSWKWLTGPLPPAKPTPPKNEGRNGE